MNNLLYLYQHIPYHLNPIAFAVGNFAADWYSLMYLMAFLVAYLLLRYRITKGEWNCSEIPNSKFQNELLLDLMLTVFVGLLIGGRLGYVLFYNLTYYLQNPLAIISPYDAVTHQFIGIYGMSYHGGLIGAILVGWIFIKIKKLDFWQWANFVAPAIPAGYFFGRIGNFLNGELYGRVTDKFWGMYFPSDPFGLLRHPSELYEAILEGPALFLVLWMIRNNQKYQGNLFGAYVVGYASMRIIAEFFREPDEQIGFLFGGLTLGQLLSLCMLVLGFLTFFIGRKDKKMVQ